MHHSSLVTAATCWAEVCLWCAVDGPVIAAAQTNSTAANWTRGDCCLVTVRCLLLSSCRSLKPPAAEHQLWVLLPPLTASPSHQFALQLLLCISRKCCCCCIALVLLSLCHQCCTPSYCLRLLLHVLMRRQLTVHPFSAIMSHPGVTLTASFIKEFLQMYTELLSGMPLRNFCMVCTCIQDQERQLLKQAQFRWMYRAVLPDTGCAAAGTADTQ